MCGIVGISAESNVAGELYDSMLMLQHRGQDAAGMVVSDNKGRLNSRKSKGYVRDVFRQTHMEKLIGNYGIAHVRYPTAGTSSAAEAQPLYVNHPYGISLAHNGNLTNAKELAKDLYANDLRHKLSASVKTKRVIMIAIQIKNTVGKLHVSHYSGSDLVLYLQKEDIPVLEWPQHLGN